MDGTVVRTVLVADLVNPEDVAAASPTSAKSKTPYGQDAFAVRTGCICRVDRH